MHGVALRTCGVKTPSILKSPLDGLSNNKKLQIRAKGVSGGRRGIAKLVLVIGLLLEVAAGGTCTGYQSSSLAPEQCRAWGKFWDGAGGPNWTNCGEWCTKSDPCACSSDEKGCGVYCATLYNPERTSITSM